MCVCVCVYARVCVCVCVCVCLKPAEALIPDEAECRRFWEHFAKLPYASNHGIHALMGVDGVLGDVCPFPMHIHVDGVKIFKGSGANQENVQWSWSSALVHLHARRCKFWMGQVPLHMFTSDTNFFFTSFVRWCLEVMRKGVTPRLGFYREDLKEAGGRALPGLQFMPALFAGVKSDAKEKRIQHLCSLRRIHLAQLEINKTNEQTKHFFSAFYDSM